ncbi:MAG: hypothetical protein HUK24_00195, partial [Sphaerochaetaceae bacterium]|nr:hypothetical protein [Sphaerochaetaceae bacterium]
CTFTAEDLVLEGVDYTIPTIGKFLPATQSVLPLGDAFGLLFPSDVPQEAKDALESAFIKACESEAALRFASEKGVVGLKNMGIKESDALRDSTVMSIGYALYNSGAAPNSPAKFGY